MGLWGRQRSRISVQPLSLAQRGCFCTFIQPSWGSLVLGAPSRSDAHHSRVSPHPEGLPRAQQAPALILSVAGGLWVIK